ncbi:SDR family NAD(P)-dependent oxidoreductase [Nocardia sp. NPDC056000]|uniref:SDR family NAD(P)-dependent oxidoreductase n=1 Tax=Nocardia sp. NPDC056000 TaxID=3345674 RepID=UPI0035DDC4D6
MKTAIVTGAASGIGKGYAVALVERGYFVLVTDIDAVGAERVAKELDALGPGRAQAKRVDVTDADAVATAVHEVVDQHGRLDMIFNNAGLAVAGPVEQLGVEHWRKACEVMVMGVAHGVDAAYKVMVEQGFGHIVNTASVAGLIPAPFMGPYNMAKHAVVGMTQSLRAEAAPRGVNVTCVCPIAVDTNIVRQTNDGVGAVTESILVATLYNRIEPLLHYVPTFLVETPESHGRKVVRAALRNRSFVILPAYGRALWWLSRLNPVIVTGLGSGLTRVADALRPRVQEQLTTRASDARIM